MLQIKNLKKYFGGVKAVDGCTFEIPDGRITALIGPNGAGKSTVFNLISGNVTEDSGAIHLDDNILNGMPIHKRASMGLSRTFQTVRLFKNLSIEENLLLAINPKDQNFWESFWRKEDDLLKFKIQEVLSLVGLDKDKATRACDLSYGEQKLLELAKAFLFPHKILMLDEPVAGISPVLREKLKKIMKMLKLQRETILIIEHDMNFVFEVADIVIVMNQGKVLTQGSPSKIQKDAKVLEVYLGQQL